jgi:hypothetical protein
VVIPFFGLMDDQEWQMSSLIQTMLSIHCKTRSQ